MKVEIESVDNGYIITIPTSFDNEIKKKIVIQEQDSENQNMLSNQSLEGFMKMVAQLQDVFEIHNSKHNTIGYINGLCSEHIRWDINDKMEKSLENQKKDIGD